MRLPGEEEAIRDRMKKRAQFLKPDTRIDKKDQERLQKELQQDHQKVLLWEAQSRGEERQQWLKLRREMEEQSQQIQQDEIFRYRQISVKMAPKQTVIKNTIMAFLVGGAISTIGQAITNLFLQGGLAEKDAGAATAAVLVFFGAILTGLGIYDELGRYAGAGSIVPITGFANSIASSAMEFRNEGFIYGVGARLFTVAGPVIVYGVLLSMFVGIFYYFVR